MILSRRACEPHAEGLGEAPGTKAEVSLPPPALLIRSWPSRTKLPDQTAPSTPSSQTTVE